VDRTSNRQIYKKHFTQVPLLKNLVDTFETMFPYLSVDLVRLLHKSKEGDGFQGWHKAFCWVDKSPRLLLLMLEVKRETMERQPDHLTTMCLSR
jgi:hypothetical protein